MTALELKRSPQVVLMKLAADISGETLECHLRELLSQKAIDIEIEKCSFQEIYNVKATLTANKYGVFFIRIQGITAHARFFLIRL